MKADVQFDFLVNKEKSTITIKREFAAKRQLVWDCYTKSELLDQWFAPKPLTTKTKFMDFSEGGHWHYAMVEPSGQEYWGRMDYQTIQPITNYTSLDGFCDNTGALNPAFPRSKWNVTFSDITTHTLVETVVSYSSPEALQQVIKMGLKEGLTSTLERLDELLLILN
ncbi:SRPBCC family protein [Solimicrobium silvestre]|uniref:Activator of Hsp90 ATPase 1-like protein n=1 Tax=Solimicrobium silvestre TaxID=2099400 RepID=A0A2S9GVW4_9BURK|nr:SRPBCC domain-containing protein [Solimicrobium silvestre]PRC91796.1 Activator of Hsp90 ATPase 1-like protein [Solimicrobium silvestre]